MPQQVHVDTRGVRLPHPSQPLSDQLSSSDPSGMDKRYGYVIVSSSFVLMCTMWIAFYSFGIFFKPILNEFGWTRAATAGAFSLCSVIQGLLAVAMGGLTDRLGPRIVMTFCGVLLGAAYLLMSQIHSLWHFYLFFSIILGIGMGGSFVPLMTLTARWFVAKRGAMTGIVASGTGVGALAGPPLAVILISHLGWRTSYAVLAAAVFALVVLSAQLLKPAPGHIKKGRPGINRAERGRASSMKELPSVMRSDPGNSGHFLLLSSVSAFPSSPSWFI